VQVIYQAASVKPAPAYKKMLLLREADDTEFNQVLENMVHPYPLHPPSYHLLCYCRINNP
jgi:hypothetical protein